MARTQTDAMRKVLREHKKCELCGSSRELQAHHILPVVFNGEDDESNILCVCKKCHSLLTPHSYLTKIGQLKHSGQWEMDFWRHFNDIVEAGETVSAVEVMDYVDDKIFPLLRAFAGQLSSDCH